jgi:uncharacterized protein
MSTIPSIQLQTLSPKRRRLVEDILVRVAPYEPMQVILFGSVARDESDEVSDIDLVIIKETAEDFFSRIRKVLQILNLKTGIDVLVYTPGEFRAMQEQGNVLIETVLEEGIVLYG